MKPPRHRVVESGCFEFVGVCLPNGYGKVGRAGRTWLAHRLAWRVARGEVPEGMCVLHRCDNRRCVNPEHLFLGTRADNMQDMIAKGRARFVGLTSPSYRPPKPRAGEANGRAKLNAAEVAAIKAADGVRQVDLAAQYGVSQAQVQRIRAGNSWGVSHGGR